MGRPIAYVFLGLLTCLGCSGAVYQMPRIDLPPEHYEVLGESEASATGIQLFQLFPIQLNNKFERAVDAAIAKRDGQALVNVSVQEKWFWAYVLNGYTTSVRGTVVRQR